MQFKDYQQTVLNIFDRLLDELIVQREKARKIEAAMRLKQMRIYCDLCRIGPLVPGKL